MGFTNVANTTVNFAHTSLKNSAKDHSIFATSFAIGAIVTALTQHSHTPSEKK